MWSNTNFRINRHCTHMFDYHFIYSVFTWIQDVITINSLCDDILTRICLIDFVDHPHPECTMVHQLLFSL